MNDQPEKDTSTERPPETDGAGELSAGASPSENADANTDASANRTSANGSNTTASDDGWEPVAPPDVQGSPQPSMLDDGLSENGPSRNGSSGNGQPGNLQSGNQTSDQDRQPRSPRRRSAGGRRNQRQGSRQQGGPPGYAPTAQQPERLGPPDDSEFPPVGNVEDNPQRPGGPKPLDPEDQVSSIPDLEKKSREELTDHATRLDIPNAAMLRPDDLVHRIVQALGERRGTINASGILEIINDGYGFLRHANLHHNINDVYVSQSQIRRFGLRTGDFVTGQIRSPKSGEKFYGLLRVDAVNTQEPEVARHRPPFDQLTALFPDELFDLETSQGNLSTRLLNLVAPMGKGQRGLIVSPPKAGKTILLHQIAHALTMSYPETHVIAALIGERPEEVTDWRRTVTGAEVVASTFDEPVEEHTRVAEIAQERAKRLVEAGQDVVILLDSITRLTRAYNLAAPSSGKTLSGGMDPVALYPPKRFFGAARNTEEGGTLTIIATCLVDTGSRMDDVIYEEFKGTGNMEVHLDRKLAERHTYPAVEILKSGTRRDERLYDEKTYKGIITLRRMLAMLSSSQMDSAEATERILDRLSKTKDNAAFLTTLAKEI